MQKGGILICTVGAEQAAASESLLRDFGIRIPASPVPTVGRWHEPEPMGYYRSPFLNAKDYGKGDYKAYVVFYTGWPVEAEGEGAEVLVHGKNDLPLVVSRDLGRGRIVVIGDPGFALKKNLENIDGEPLWGGYENAHFWRWLIARVTGQPDWIPPPPPPLPPSPTGERDKGEGPPPLPPAGVKPGQEKKQ